MAVLPKQHKPKLYDRRADRFLREEEQAVSEQRALAQAARAASVGWLASLRRWDLYATLTYDPARFGIARDRDGDASYTRSVQACVSDLDGYVKSLSAVLHRPVDAAAAVELHKSGWPHAHALLAMEGVNSLGFIRTGRLWFDNHGYARLRRVDSSRLPQLSAYITKYFTKSGCDVALIGPMGKVTHNG